MIFATGDTHSDFRRFRNNCFPEQDSMTRDDVILIAGDFGGVWYPAEPFPLIAERDRMKALKGENMALDTLARKNFTIAFVPGNHENWNRLDGEEFPEVDFRGGRARRIRDNVFLLLSGYVFDFGGQTLFAFGGARSHDISGGILKREDFASDRDFRRVYREWCHSGRLFRVKDYEWWERECAPTEEEILRGWENLSRNGNRVDLVLTHCLPTSAASLIGMGSPSDPIMDYLEEVKNRISFGNWICGHYHRNQTVDKRFHILYEQIVEVRKSH